MSKPVGSIGSTPVYNEPVSVMESPDSIIITIHKKGSLTKVDTTHRKTDRGTIVYLKVNKSNVVEIEQV